MHNHPTLPLLLTMNHDHPVTFFVCLPCRGQDSGVAEKKVAILQKALEHHPGSERILLALLQAYSTTADVDQLNDKWEKVLARHPASWLLRTEYLCHRCGTMCSCSKVSLSRGTPTGESAQE